VSEGCSYTILESINHEIPIIITDIHANNEIISDDLQPKVKFQHQNDFSSKFCTSDYNDELDSIGYICANKCCNDCKSSLKYVSCYLQIDDEILCNNCQNYIKNQKRMFIKNVKHVVNAFTNMIINYHIYKSNIQIIKRNLTSKYFSSSNYSKNIFNLLFDDITII